jgi:hypothetical protein
VYGRWNPFRPPTVGYQHVPRTTWEARNEVVHHTNTRTEWVAEKRTVEVPTRIVKMQREQKVDFEPVGRVNQQNLGPSAASDALATRLRPLDDPSSIEPFGYSAPRVASTTITSSYGGPSRSLSQQGMPPTQLTPSTPGPVGLPASTGVAASPLPIYR